MGKTFRITAVSLLSLLFLAPEASVPSLARQSGQPIPQLNGARLTFAGGQREYEQVTDPHDTVLHGSILFGLKRVF